MPKAKNPNMGRPVLNKYKVPAKRWGKWSNLAKKVFNDVMDAMRPKQQWVFLHPKATPQPKDQWQTTRYNAAWIAADSVDGQPQMTRVVEVHTNAGTHSKYISGAKRKAPKKVTRRPPKPAPNLGLVKRSK